ncbi:orexigenic neuropeptide QRFP [Mus pahari]|uniref:orexigenic neuropeptide QRFP n=1 Tax=Mus pahari TaxID=10093 RepID=UPI000A3114CB|nr:orexigenic neuropeptide QRFP [Mus pahari]
MGIRLIGPAGSHSGYDSLVDRVLGNQAKHSQQLSLQRLPRPWEAWARDRMWPNAGPRLPKPLTPSSLLPQMRGFRPLFSLFLPLSACFPLLDRRGPTDIGDIGARMSWAQLAEGHPPNLVQNPHPQALLVVAKEQQASRREHTGFRLGRQDSSSEAAGFLPADSEKASGPLGTLAEELSSYSRRKGGFSFRFGRTVRACVDSLCPV